MMINLKIPDDLYNDYLQKFGAPRHYARMKEAIEAFKDFKEHDRYIVLSGEDRQAIEAVFQTTMDDAKKLVSSIKKLASVSIEGIDMRFTPEELIRLETQATFHGRDLVTYVTEMVNEIKDRMLEKV